MTSAPHKLGQDLQLLVPSIHSRNHDPAAKDAGIECCTSSCCTLQSIYYILQLIQDAKVVLLLVNVGYFRALHPFMQRIADPKGPTTVCVACETSIL